MEGSNSPPQTTSNPSLYYTIYDSIKKYGKLPNTPLSPSNMAYYTSKLAKEGYIKRIGYGVWVILAPLPPQTTSNHNPSRSPPFIKGCQKIRGHGITFKLLLPKIENWFNIEKFLIKKHIEYYKIHHTGIAIKFKGKKVHIFKKTLIIYTKKDFIADSSNKARSYAIYDLLQYIKSIENLIGVSLKINKQYKFKIFRQHYGKIDDILAKQYDREGKKLKVSNEGGLWLIIDNSYNLHELETLHPQTAHNDMDNAIIPFFNSLKDKEGFTADFILESLHKLIEDRKYYAETIKNHVSAIEELGHSVKKFTDQVKKFNKINK